MLRVGHGYKAYAGFGPKARPVQSNPYGSQCWFRPSSYRVKACHAPITPIGYRGISPSPQVEVCALTFFGSVNIERYPSNFLPPPSYHQTDTNVNVSLNNHTVSYCTCKMFLSNVWIIYIQPLCCRPASFSATLHTLSTRSLYTLSLCAVTASLGYTVQGGGSGATRHAHAQRRGLIYCGTSLLTQG